MFICVLRRARKFDTLLKVATRLLGVPTGMGRRGEGLAGLPLASFVFRLLRRASIAIESLALHGALDIPEGRHGTPLGLPKKLPQRIPPGILLELPQDRQGMPCGDPSWDGLG